MLLRLALLTAAIAALVLWPRGLLIGSPKHLPPPADIAKAQPARGADADAHHREWELVAAADGESCRRELTALGIRFRPLPDRTEPDANGCGIPHGVVVTRGPLGISYVPPLQIDCTLARELPWIEQTMQDEAEKHLGSPLKQISTFGT